MKRFLMTVAVAAVALATLAVQQTRAQGHSERGPEHFSSGSSHHGSMSDHQFRASRRFDYGRHGYRSLSWTHSYWSNYYRCNCYWAPTYGWCFYEPSYSCYVPVSRYFEVYPEAVSVGSAPVIPPPTAIQQTTVVVGSPTQAAVPVVPPAPAAVPVVPPAPAPTAVQQTKVGAGGP